MQRRHCVTASHRPVLRRSAADHLRPGLDVELAATAAVAGEGVGPCLAVALTLEAALPLPCSGITAALCKTLSSAAFGNLIAARVFEVHSDATAILAEAAGAGATEIETPYVGDVGSLRSRCPPSACHRSCALGCVVDCQHRGRFPGATGHCALR